MSSGAREPAADARALLSAGTPDGEEDDATSVTVAPLLVAGKTTTVDTPPATVAGTLVVPVVLVVTVWLAAGVAVGVATGVVATLPPLHAARAAINKMPPSRMLSRVLGTRKGRPPRHKTRRYGAVA